MARKRSSVRRKMRIRSKQQQKFVWGVLVNQRGYSARKAKNRSKKGKAYSRLPSRVKKGKRR